MSLHAKHVFIIISFWGKNVTGLNGNRKGTEEEKIVQRLRCSLKVEPYQPDLLRVGSQTEVCI